MPRPFQQQQDADGPGGTALVTVAETVICTLPGLSTGGPDAKVIIEATAQITTGTATTGVQLRIRRGTTTAGAQVGATAQQNVGAALAAAMSVQVDDNPGEVVGQQYVLTAQQIAATGNGTAVASNMTATYN